MFTKIRETYHNLMGTTYCLHGTPHPTWCDKCWKETGERIDREDREARVREIADGVKLALTELGKTR